METEKRVRIHQIKECIFTLTVGLDELSNGYRFDDKYGARKIEKLIAARDAAILELNQILKNL